MPASASALWAGGLSIEATPRQITYHVLVCGTPGQAIRLAGSYQELDEEDRLVGRNWRVGPWFARLHRYCEWFRASERTLMLEGAWMGDLHVNQGGQFYVAYPARFFV